MLRRDLFYYLRHGETDWNLEHRAQGQIDVPLNQTGLAQAEAVGPIVADLGIATICSSPLSRALDTAKAAQSAIGCLLVVEDALTECSWGAYEGQVKGPWYDDWMAGRAAIEGAESYEAFLNRSLQGINKALALPGPVMIVAHGGVYWAIQRELDRLHEGVIPNCLPVRHSPPSDGDNTWQVEVIDGRAD